jgi:hypothetical protein
MLPDKFTKEKCDTYPPGTIILLKRGTEIAHSGIVCKGKEGNSIYDNQPDPTGRKGPRKSGANVRAWLDFTKPYLAITAVEVIIPN